MRLSALGLIVLFAGALARPALAAGDPVDPQSAALFATAAKELRDGKVSEAIDGFEALADRGVLDAAASFDRGLAYAARIRIGAELPGDLGRAAQGFEEARALSEDARLDDEASRALTVVRSEVARRRLRAGQPADVEAGRSLARALSGLVSEGAWAIFAIVCSFVLSFGLFVRWLATDLRLRVFGGVAAAVAAPALLMACAMTLAARHDRLDLHEAVVVNAEARPVDDRGLRVPGGTPLPEGALVEVIDRRAGATRVRFGATDDWIASGALRDVAKR